MQMIKKYEKIEADFQKIISGCGKQTGYFESSPYCCGDIVQTTPCDGFQSYCRKCYPKVKKAMDGFETLIIPAREKLKKLNSEKAGKTCATKHVIPPKPKDSGILPNFT